jgi:hypothetical protein
MEALLSPLGVVGLEALAALTAVAVADNTVTPALPNTFLLGL